MIKFRQGCLSLIGAALVLFTVAFATSAFYLEFHDLAGHARHPRPLGLALLIVGIVAAFTGAGYMMYLDWRPRPPRPDSLRKR